MTRFSTMSGFFSLGVKSFVLSKRSVLQWTAMGRRKDEMIANQCLEANPSQKADAMSATNMRFCLKSKIVVYRLFTNNKTKECLSLLMRLFLYMRTKSSSVVYGDCALPFFMLHANSKAWGSTDCAWACERSLGLHGARRVVHRRHEARQEVHPRPISWS